MIAGIQFIFKIASPTQLIGHTSQDTSFLLVDSPGYAVVAFQCNTGGRIDSLGATFKRVE